MDGPMKKSVSPSAVGEAHPYQFIAEALRFRSPMKAVKSSISTTPRRRKVSSSVIRRTATAVAVGSRVFPHGFSPDGGSDK